MVDWIDKTYSPATATNGDSFGDMFSELGNEFAKAAIGVFKQTSTGQKIFAEARQQEINSLLNDPMILIAGGAIIYFAMKGVST